MKIDEVDFLIIGAAKSATTWLQQSLQMDPAVCMPDPEIHYFSREYDRGAEWYCAQFPEPEGYQLVGEKSNSYLDTPNVAGRIHAALPHVRLVAQLRNPVERAYSDYCMLYRRGEVGRDIDLYLDPREASENRFLNSGFYHRQLCTYLEYFSVDQMLVLLYEDTRIAPAEQLALVRSFLGVAPSTSPSALKARVKDKTTPVIPPALKRYLRPLKPIVAPLRKRRFFKALHGTVARKLEYPPMTADLRNRLVDYYAAEMELLSKLLVRDLSAWLQETPSAASQSSNS